MFCRFYHISSVSYSFKKQGAKLCKMINPSSKKQWYPSVTQQADVMPSVKSLTNTKYEPGKRGIRRIAMLNKLFMKQITDLMSTGTVSMDIVGRGISISKVQVTPDFQTVNVFWVCKGNTTDIETDALLNNTAGALRHELSCLRVMGQVPYVRFVKDKQESLLIELDQRLSIADYGENYNPTELGHILKTEFTLDTKLSPEMKAKIKRLEDEFELIDDTIPEMTHNVFGLDHAKIMTRLLAARKKSKDAWGNLAADSPVISYRAAEHEMDVDTGKQSQDLADFLLKRKILQNKLHKEMRSSRALEMVYDDKNNGDDDEECYEDDGDYYDDDAEYYDDERLKLDEHHGHKST